jgi:hypothetical protein
VGPWVHAGRAFDVVGIHHRLESAVRFADAAIDADANGLAYGVSVHRERDNPADVNALAVWGFWDVENTELGASPRRTAHVGYVPKDVAAAVCNEDILAIELMEVFKEDGLKNRWFVNVKARLLKPRQKVRHRAEK